ncbi:MAG: ribbon-helix-helix protein, CopG family [Thiobacillus sp.]
MATLTVRIDDRMETELSKLAEATHRTKSDLAREMLRRQIAIRRFQDLRAKAIPYAEAAGYLTDEDVFRDAS